MSNSWNGSAEQGHMKVREDIGFQIKTGLDNQYHLRCAVTDGRQETPYVVMPVDPEEIEKR